MLEEYRGRGLGVELVREMVDERPVRRAQVVPAHEDAHELYRKFGFSEPERARARARKPLDRDGDGKAEQLGSSAHACVVRDDVLELVAELECSCQVDRIEAAERQPQLAG